MTPSALKILTLIKQRHPNQNQFRRKVIHQAMEDLGLTEKDYKPLIADTYKVHKGLYDYSTLNVNSSNTAEIGRAHV